MQTAAASFSDRFSDTLDGMRASIALEGTRTGLAGAMLAAILGLLDAMLALLREFKAGTLVAAAPNAASGEATGDCEPAGASGCGHGSGEAANLDYEAVRVRGRRLHPGARSGSGWRCPHPDPPPLRGRGRSSPTPTRPSASRRGSYGASGRSSGHAIFGQGVRYGIALKNLHSPQMVWYVLVVPY